jgi:hypothetical protein
MNDESPPQSQRQHFTVVCPKCLNGLRVRSVYNGHHVRCKFCQHKFLAQAIESEGSSSSTELPAPVAHRSQVQAVAGGVQEEADPRIRLACPQCRSTLKIRRSYDGRHIRCKRCDHKFRVSIAEQAQPADASPPVERPTELDQAAVTLGLRSEPIHSETTDPGFSPEPTSTPGSSLKQETPSASESESSSESNETTWISEEEREHAAPVALESQTEEEGDRPETGPLGGEPEEPSFAAFSIEALDRLLLDPESGIGIEPTPESPSTSQGDLRNDSGRDADQGGARQAGDLAEPEAASQGNSASTQLPIENLFIEEIDLEEIKGPVLAELTPPSTESNDSTSRREEEAEQEFQRLQKAHDAIHSERDRLAAERDRMQAELEDFRQAMDRLEAELAQLRSDRDSVEAELAHHKTNHQKITAELSEAQSEQGRIQAERERLLDERDQIHAELGAIRASLNEMGVEPGFVPTLLEERDCFQNERDVIQAAYDRILNERDAIQAEHDRITAERDVLQVEHDQAINQLETLQAERDRLAAELAHREERGKHEANEQLEQIRLRDRRIEDLLAEVETTREAVEAQKAIGRDLETRLEKAQAQENELAHLNSELKRGQEAWKQKEQELDRRESELRHRHDAVTRLEGELKQREEQLSQAEDKQKHRENELAQSADELKRRQAEVDRRERELAAKPTNGVHPQPPVANPPSSSVASMLPPAELDDLRRQLAESEQTRSSLAAMLEEMGIRLH